MAFDIDCLASGEKSDEDLEFHEDVFLLIIIYSNFAPFEAKLHLIIQLDLIQVVVIINK
jgi:hypothetical protein